MTVSGSDQFAVRVPVLAKEFIVDARQLDVVRAAGADFVLLLAALPQLSLLEGRDLLRGGLMVLLAVVLGLLLPR